VKALQRLLTHSFSGRALAVRRVTENQGKRTPGVDGEVWKTPDEKAAGIERLQQCGYHPRPLRRIYIPKSDGKKKRPLGIPTMLDRAMQALYLLALDPSAEMTADRNSYGFRLERSTADAIEQCFTLLSRQDRARWIWEGDIHACFDEIGHDWMLSHIPTDKTILCKWLKAGYMEKGVLHPTEAGTPQGGICSPVLANMTLDGLEERLRRAFPKTTAHGQKTKINMVRFADDLIITGNSKELLETEVQPLVEQFLGERGLNLSQEKTHITHIEDGFNFLGQNIRKHRGKLIITPSKKNVKAFLTKVREVIRKNRQATAGELIAQLNPIIRGWANYHRHICSGGTFGRVDHAIFKALWQWAKRRHPNKSKRWIKQKYFHTANGRNWVFEGELKDKTEQTHIVRLFYASKVRIKRHIKIKGDANPYDPQWEPYLEARRSRKMVDNLQGRMDILALWKEQDGKCPVCDQTITIETRWHDHHIVWRSKGGRDNLSNRVLVHPDCHRQIHSQRLDVAKPRLARGV
jgi:RNA-directed DNA polymerase